MRGIAVSSASRLDDFGSRMAQLRMFGGFTRHGPKLTGCTHSRKRSTAFASRAALPARGISEMSCRASIAIFSLARSTEPVIAANRERRCFLIENVFFVRISVIRGGWIPRSASCEVRMSLPLTTYLAGRRGSVSFSLDTSCQDLRQVLCFDLRLAYSRRLRFRVPIPLLRFPCRVFARRLLCSRVPNGVWCSRELTPNKTPEATAVGRFLSCS